MLQQLDDLNDARAAIALDQGEFHLLFQPKIELASAKMTGAEAYVRWAHPELGRLLPASFLSALERQERLADLTNMVLRESAQAARRWYNQGRSWHVTVNLSPAELIDPELGDRLTALVDECELPYGLFVFDIPESAFLVRDENLIPVLEDMRHRGFGLALEGRGAMTASAEDIPLALFNEIKVSGSAIIKFALTTKSAGGLIAERQKMAAAHALPLTAVGAEDARTLHALKELGFTYAQGAFISRPAEARVLDTWTVPAAVKAALTGPAPRTRKATAPQRAEKKPASKAAPLKKSLQDTAFGPEMVTLDFEAIGDFDLALPGPGNFNPLCLIMAERMRLIRHAPQLHGRRVPGIGKRIVMKVPEPPMKKPRRTGMLARLGF
jgi:EAL domain-containing protein (putative c-di-GMP-specific phosphodiesterase class I)